MQEKYNTILEAVFGHAETMPDKVAVIDAEGKTTYAELAKGIRRAATILHNAGVEKGDRVLLSAPPRVETLFAYFGAQVLGAIPSPISRTLTAGEAGWRMDFLQCRAAFLDDKLAEILGTDKFSRFADSNVPEYTENIAIDVDDVESIFFTGATTGKPKGVMLTYKNRVAGARNRIIGHCLSEESVWLIPDTLFNVGNGYAAATFLEGGTVVLSEFDFKKIYEAIKANGCTVFHCSPPYIMAIDRLLKGKISQMFGGLKTLAIGGMCVPVNIKSRLLQELPDTDIRTSYGETEGSSIVTASHRNKNDPIQSVGKPTPFCQIKIVDDNGNEIISSVDNPGKIAVKGDMVMKGYWKNEEATKSAIRDGWLVINDYGYMDDKGYLYILGRADDVINVNGEKVSPLEIEEAANLFEGVSESCCIGVDDPLGLGRQVPVLYVTMKENTSFSENEIQAHLSKHLEKYKLPYKIICIDEIPVNERGKYLRRELANLWRESAGQNF